MVERYPVCPHRNVPAAFDHFLTKDGHAFVRPSAAKEALLAALRFTRLFSASRAIATA